MSAFNHEVHKEKLLEYENKFFEVLPEIFTNKSSEYAKDFYHYLYPINDNIELY